MGQLRRTPEGNRALEIQRRYRVTVRYGAPGERTYFDPAINTAVIDPSERRPIDTLIVHEMIHAEYDNTGRSANDRTTPRDEYVERAVDEEIEAVIAEIRHDIGAHPNRLNDITKIGSIYAEPYYRVRQQVLSETGNEEVATEAGHDAGRAAIVNAFSTGLIGTGNTPYAQYYGDEWDRVHRQGASASQGPNPPTHYY